MEVPRFPLWVRIPMYGFGLLGLSYLHGVFTWFLWVALAAVLLAVLRSYWGGGSAE